MSIVSIKSLVSKIPDYIDKCPGILRDIPEYDRNALMDILRNAKNRRSNENIPLFNYLSQQDRVRISDAIDKAPEVETYDVDEYDYDYCIFD